MWIVMSRGQRPDKRLKACLRVVSTCFYGLKRIIQPLVRTMFSQDDFERALL